MDDADKKERFAQILKPQKAHHNFRRYFQISFLRLLELGIYRKSYLLKEIWNE